MFEPSKEISVHVMAKDVIWGIPHHFGRVLGVLVQEVFQFRRIVEEATRSNQAVVRVIAWLCFLLKTVVAICTQEKPVYVPGTCSMSMLICVLSGLLKFLCGVLPVIGQVDPRPRTCEARNNQKIAVPVWIYNAMAFTCSLEHLEIAPDSCHEHEFTVTVLAETQAWFVYENGEYLPAHDGHMSCWFGDEACEHSRMLISLMSKCLRGSPQVHQR